MASSATSEAMPSGAPAHASRHTRSQALVLPTVSRSLVRGCKWYIPRYLRRHFNAVRLAKGTAPIVRPDRAVVCFTNHPGWWDPLIAAILHQRFLGGRTAYAPIDAHALQRYPVLRKLGFFGIDRGSRRGAKQFLAVTRELLKHSQTAIWITPGGQFTDPRSRTRLQPGLAHIATTVSEVTFIPLAIEYPFWEERTPEALVEFGQPLCAQRDGRAKQVWHAELEDRLAAVQASLAGKAIARSADGFEILLEGSAGIGGCYDLLRRARFLMTGKSVDLRHGRRPAKEATGG